MDKYKPHLLYPSVDGHLGCFHILVIVNSAAMNFGVHVIFQISIFIFFLIYMHRQAGSLPLSHHIHYLVLYGHSLLIVALDYKPSEDRNLVPLGHFCILGT